MKKFLSTLCSCCLCCLTVLALTVTTAHSKGGRSKGESSGGGSVCICHNPPGNPDNAHTICIGAPAVRAHLKHGDTMGECPVSCNGNDDCGADQFCQRDEGVCAEGAIGVCTDLPTTCPTTIAPVCGCDGNTYDNACEASAAGVTIASEGACPTGACGGDTGATCEDDQFCKIEPGVCDESAEGVCTDIPAACPTTFDPVCGCDGETYANACVADGAGVNVASAGECPEGGVACGGAAGDTCADTEFCKLETGACSQDAEGVCTAIPGACPVSFIPVCGCDGVTYSNECFAASAGASIAAEGACPQGAACVVGGGTCAAGEFCRPAIGDCAASAEGHCTPIPEVCPPPLSNIPVCGCDGVTYANACAAFAAGVGIASPGECEADQQACGGTEGGTCGEGEFCIRPVGECAEDAEGVCQSTPVVCTSNIAPVCGCDGITYSNACAAAGAGVTVEHEGECGEPVACDGATGVTCPAGQFCKHADGACGAEVEGVCTDTPLTCEPIDSPVCACIGVGFPNACYANAVGYNIQNTGTCEQPVACDGATGVTCADGQFCKHADGACAADIEGVCTDTPLTCEPVDSPVCTCIGVGYPNACYANAVGLNIENTGACVDSVACDGTTGVTCPAGQFCKHADGACAADVEGVCTETPLTCPPIDDPVCSCIGVGFPNACFANAVGLNIENTGACTP